MKCENIKEPLSAYADNELTDAQRNLVEEHVASCADCRALLADYTEVRRQLLSLRETPPLPDVEEATMTKIKMVRAPTKLRRWLRPALVGIPVVIIVAVVLSLQPFSSPDDTSGVISKAYAATTELESFRYVKEEYTQDSESEEPVHSYHAEIEYTTPDRYHMKSQSFTREIPPTLPDILETIRIGDQVYTNTPSLFKLEPEWFERMTPTEDKTLDFLNLLAETETLEDESIDGMDCYHYIGEVDIDKYLELLRPELERMYYRMDRSLPWGMTTDLEDWIENCNSSYLTQDMTFEFWIGKDDYLLRKAKLVYQTRKGETSTWNKYKSIGIMNYYDFNEEIVIEAPLDESGELPEGWSTYTIEPLEIPDETAPETPAPAPRKPEGFQEIPASLVEASAVTEKLESFRMTSTTYEHFNDGFNNSRNTIVEYGGYNLYRSLLEPTEEYKKSSPIMGMSMELVIIGDKVYTRNFVVPPTDTSDFNDSGPTSESSRVVLEMLFDIETLPDEEINGTDCYHYRGILDTENYLEWFRPIYKEDLAKMNEIQKETSGVELDFEQSWKTMEIIYRSNEKIYEYWIGKDDYIIRKRILIDRKLLENPLPVDDLSDESTRQVITEYYDFNEEIIIEAPRDESGELLEGWVLTTLEE